MNRKLKQLIHGLDRDRKKYDCDDMSAFWERYGREVVEQEKVMESLDLIMTGICDLINFMDEYEEEYE
jgi:hypothetical protein